MNILVGRRIINVYHFISVTIDLHVALPGHAFIDEIS